MRYTQELADRAQVWVDRALADKRSPEGLNELAAIWSLMQGQPASSCRQCQYSDYNAAVAAYLREFSRHQHPELMSASQYQLAPAFANETLVHDSYNKVVTADNLTDEDAEFFIKNGRPDLFIKKDGTAVEETAPEPAKHAKKAKPDAHAE